MDATAALSGSPSSAPRLLDQVRGKIRLKHYSLRTEQTYLDWIRRFIRHSGKRHPRELGAAEVQAMLARLSGTHGLIARLLYGTGMRLMECLRLRVKDVDFARGEILVRDGKGFKDRVTMLPTSVAPALQEHLARVQELHRQDMVAGHGEVHLLDRAAQ